MEGVFSGGVVVWQTMPVRSSSVRPSASSAAFAASTPIEIADWLRARIGRDSMPVRYTMNLLLDGRLLEREANR